MKFPRSLFQSMIFFLIAIYNLPVQAQSSIKVNGQSINHLDKQKRKQGDWIFFDKEGFAKMSCVFKDDICISPQVFYENSDTAFVRLPIKDSVETFVLFHDNKKYIGSFVHTSDTTTVTEVESDTTLNESILSKIKKYKNLVIEPNYFFGQKRIIDYMGASFSSSNFIFNKPLNIYLYISSSGDITKVEFPRDKNNLSGDEERELNWIYSTMPRWQPLFYKNKTLPVKIMLSNNATLSVLSFDH